MKKLTTHDELVDNVGKRVKFDFFLGYSQYNGEGIIQVRDNEVAIKSNGCTTIVSRRDGRNISVFNITLLDEPEQYIPKFGERALFSLTGFDWEPLIFMGYVEQGVYPYMTVLKRWEKEFLNGEKTQPEPYPFCKPLEKKTITLTKQ
jgi:hypothetical protein